MQPYGGYTGKRVHIVDYLSDDQLYFSIISSESGPCIFRQWPSLILISKGRHKQLI